MEIKAKYTVGDPVNVKLGYRDNEVADVSLRFEGTIFAVRFHKGTHFPDRILYDVILGQADGPDVIIQNLGDNLVHAGWERIEDEEKEKDNSLLPQFEQLLRPVQP